MKGCRFKANMSISQGPQSESPQPLTVSRDLPVKGSSRSLLSPRSLIGGCIIVRSLLHNLKCCDLVHLKLLSREFRNFLSETAEKIIKMTKLFDSYSPDSTDS